MIVTITIDEKTIKQLLVDHINKQLGEMAVDLKDVKLYTKSRQNYRSTWEECGAIVTNRPEDAPELKAEAKL